MFGGGGGGRVFCPIEPHFVFRSVELDLQIPTNACHICTRYNMLMLEFITAHSTSVCCAVIHFRGFLT